MMSDEIDKRLRGRVKVVKNGPYLVSGGVPLAEEIMIMGDDGEPAAWERGREYPPQETYALCRCGASRNKPFCDGVHSRTNFEGKETAGHETYAEEAELTTGPAVDLTWSSKFCAVARFCHRAGEAWTLAEKSDDPQARETAIEEACACPSGSLIAWDKKNGQAIEPRLEPSIGLIENPSTNISGPIWVKGGIPIESSEGIEYEIRNRVTLCRCGASKNKPFCDGTHVAIKFNSRP
jgi:CDGSH-type Zn-finger protein